MKINDWKEYTRQIDARNKKRSERDSEEIKKFYLDAEKRRKERYIAFQIRERNLKERAREMGLPYFPSFYYPTLEFAPFPIYPNDRTVEGCLDWIAKGRPQNPYSNNHPQEP